MPSSKSKLQQKAALRAADILTSMGSTGYKLQGVDARTGAQFGTNRKSTEPLISPNPIEQATKATNLAIETRASNRRRATRQPSKGGF